MDNSQKSYSDMCSYKNLEYAYKKARKGKTKKSYVIEFEKNLKDNLLQLRNELLFHTYKPKLLETFILRDPKTRRISKSDFKDRIVHHALCNIIEPIFEKGFIYDSYANRKGKGTLKAIQRFDHFKRTISKNNTSEFFVIKSDIKKYFDNVDHEILIQIIKQKIKNERAIWLIKQILNNYSLSEEGKSMPLGNLTSQFFANIYLNELDQYVKHDLKIKYYIRYVDDFIIFEADKQILEQHKTKINNFLKNNLSIELHPDKTKIQTIKEGINFLGLRIFYNHKLLRKTNIRKIRKKLNLYVKSKTHYDQVYETLQGWQAYAKTANTYKLRNQIAKTVETNYENAISSTEINRLQKAL